MENIEDGNATVGITGSGLGTELQSLLMADDIQPGAAASYQLCKTVYTYHPIGAKMVELPLTIAQSQEREISVSDSPEDTVVNAFKEEWERLKADTHIYNTMRISRIYGIGSIVYGVVGIAPSKVIPMHELSKYNLYFNVLDPLNTSGSLVLSQDPNAPDFQKYVSVAAAGQMYHRSRSCVVMNEDPIYIEYTVSAFGYVGRSVYQRALFPLKSYVQSMVTDDLVTRKAGVIVAMIKAVGSVADKIMMGFNAFKRNILKESQTGNVISVGHEDKVESLNLQNTDTAMTTARKNILENIAAAAGMPAQMLNNETLAKGFGEGSEDAKAIAAYVDSVRMQMQPLYDFFDEIVMYRAWNANFYKTIQEQFPEEYGQMPYQQAFYKWKNSFKAQWPSLLREPESELVKIDDTRMKTLISYFTTLAPSLSPKGKGALLQWMQDNTNEQTFLFKHELKLDIDEEIAFAEEQLERQQDMEDKQNQSKAQSGGEQSVNALPGGAAPPGQAMQQLAEKSPEQKLPQQKMAALSWSNK